MASETRQTFANHSRLHPMYHYFLLPVVGINAIGAIVKLVRTPSMDSFWGLVMAFALVILTLVARGYPLKAQDRVIRLEERLRMKEILPPDLASRVGELRGIHFVALRFCSDAQLPDLVRAVLDEKIDDQKEIKKRIKDWRSDTFRV